MEWWLLIGVIWLAALGAVWVYENHIDKDHKSGPPHPGIW